MAHQTHAQQELLSKTIVTKIHLKEKKNSTTYLKNNYSIQNSHQNPKFQSPHIMI